MSIARQKVRYVFLDRDGVINRKPGEGEYIHRWNNFHILQGAEQAIARLNRSGFRVIVVTNQRGIALGLYTRADLDALHARLQQHLSEQGARIDAFYYCPHDENECNCRKPKPGLFEQAVQDFPDASPSNSLAIGDSISDIEWACNLGIPAVFIHGDPHTQKPGATKAAARANAVSGSLEEVVDKYLS